MPPVADPVDDGDIVGLLEYIRRTRRFDFTGYKRASLTRRITKRMAEVGCATYADYQDYLEVHPDEFAAFFTTILINVTSFFRDQPAWELLADEIIPRIVSGKHPGDPIRVWSAGCATGQEAYSLAITLCDALGTDQFQSRVKIFGTDADDEALAKARRATYTATELEDAPDAYLERYFEKANDGSHYVFRNDLRRPVIFGRHDLVQDAPISRIDLLVCRNTLMYFNPETQSRILDRLSFALADHGYLFLGTADTRLTQSSLFIPVDLRLRIFAKTNDAARRPVVPAVRRGGDDNAAAAPDLHSLALEGVPVPMVVVDEDGRVVLATAAARALFGLQAHDLGSPLQNLELSYRPLELRSVLVDALTEGRTRERTGVRWFDDDRRIFDVTVTPLARPDGQRLGASISFLDVTRYHRLREELEQSNRDLAAAYEKLQLTNEELETTNEELLSTIEELETTTEELQSSNEELETTNEELQATNDELHGLNDQLEHRGAELDRAKVRLEGILTGLRLGMVVLDRQLTVRVWNRWSQDLWGLRAAEVKGRSFLDLDIGLPVERLAAPIRRCLDTKVGQDVQLPARNRRGHEISCRVAFSPWVVDGTVDGVVLVMAEGPPVGHE